MIQGLVQTLLVRLPLAYYMSIQPNASLTKIGLAAPVATVTGIILNVGFFIYLNRKEKSSYFSIFLSSGSTVQSMVTKQILPPITFDTGSARNTPLVPICKAYGIR